jgi:Tol biopolymer transport system component
VLRFDDATQGAGCTSLTLYPTGQYGPGWNPAGDSIVCNSSENGRRQFAPGVYLIDVRAGRWRLLRPASAQPNYWPSRCFWNPHSRTLLFDNGGGPAVFDIDARTLRPIHDGPRQMAASVWSPEGDSVWYVRGRNNNEPVWQGGLYVISASGGTSRRFQAEEGGNLDPYEMAFSPDGGRLAFAAVRETTYNAYGQPVHETLEIGIVQRDGTRRRWLTHLGGAARHPQWVLGGEEILFDYIGRACDGVVPNPQHEVLSVNVATGRVRAWRDNLADAHFQFVYPPVPDPAGRTLLTVGDDPLRQDGYRVGALRVTNLLDGRWHVLMSRDSLGEDSSPAHGPGGFLSGN